MSRDLTKREMRQALMTEIRENITGVAVHQRQPWTCVVVTTCVNGEEREGVGFTKVQWPDAWDEEYGVTLAECKAVADVARQVMGGMR